MDNELVRKVDLYVPGDYTDPVLVWHRFIEHVARMPGVTILGTIKHDFPGGGLTGLIVLGESHAAIHTWPELGTAWIELVTCGDPAALAAFPTFTCGKFTRGLQSLSSRPEPMQ